jgi:hypothetical protein
VSHDDRKKIVKNLRDLNEEQKTKLQTIQDYAGAHVNFVRMMKHDDAFGMIDVWYDIFVICFDEHFTTIMDRDNLVAIRDVEISLNTLKNFDRGERLQIVFEIKNFTTQQSIKFKELIGNAAAPDEIYKMLTNDETKLKLVSSLDAIDETI